MPHVTKPIDITNLNVKIFESRFVKTDSCWNWIGYKTPKGYGQYMILGRQNCFAHRISYTLYKGPITPGLFVCHKCDNPSCVNPEHLFLGTADDNAKDMLSKGRFRSGVAKLKESEVIKIRELMSNGIPLRKISKKYKINEDHLRSIRKRRFWKNI